jgi:chromosome partitioning protein
MGYILALANQKGGTGKTTSTINLGGALAEMGYKVLLVDMDPQASLSVGMGLDVFSLDKSMYNVIVAGKSLETIIVKARENIDVAPSNIYLSAGELELASSYRREDRLKNALNKVKDRYDYLLIDPPPTLGLLTINALSAAGYALIPMSCDYYSLVGVRLLVDSIGRTREQLNPDLEILGIVATRFDKRTIHSQEVLDEAKAKLGEHVRIFKTIIPETVRFKEAPVAGQTITEYSSDHAAATSYRDLAQEVVDVFAEASVSKRQQSPTS